jgi:hypothetical protein
MASTAFPTEAQAVGGGRSEASGSLGHLDAVSHEKDRGCHLPVPITVLSFYPTVVRVP